MSKQRALYCLALLMVKLRLLPLLLAIADRWRLQQQTTRHLSFPTVRRRKDRPFQILLYHRVNDAKDPFIGGIPVKVFASQMAMIHDGFTVLPLEELVERAIKDDVPPRAVAVTFDDGYRDNYDNAYPILKQFSLPATIFLATGALDTTPMLWHDRVFDAFRRTRAHTLAIHAQVYPLRTIADKRLALRACVQDLRRCNPRDRDELIQHVTAQLGVPEPDARGAQKLRWNEIEEMAQHRIVFGAHTVTHPILTRMPLTEALDEIVTSKTRIEQCLGAPVRLFAYPNGKPEDFNEAIQGALKEAGFLCAVTTLWGNNDAHMNPYELRRVGAWGVHPQMAGLRLGWYRLSS